MSAAEVLLFEIGGVRYGADLTQVRRIDRPRGPPTVGTILGTPAVPIRALVFDVPGAGERRLDVDAVLGVRSVSAGELRRLPQTAGAPPMALGALIEGEEATLLVDLLALAPQTGSI
jgi:hypothetical protein